MPDSLPDPKGFCESFEEYLVRCGLRLPYRDDKNRYQDPDCRCRGQRQHYRHDAACPVGVVYRQWNAFMQERWRYVQQKEKERHEQIGLVD